MTQASLNLELLNGPLDGHIVTLTSEATWGAKGDGPLVFPWDAELGDRQARFFFEKDEWWLEAYSARHGTYSVNRESPQRIEGKIRLENKEILKASDTWLLVRLREE